MEFFTKFPVMERSALAEFRKSIDFAFRDFSRASEKSDRSTSSFLLNMVIFTVRYMMESSSFSSFTKIPFFLNCKQKFLRNILDQI